MLDSESIILTLSLYKDKDFKQVVQEKCAKVIEN
jgi:hypothetical protein